ncbi:MAG: HAD family phosphatase [Clostridiales bacterium]|nr:HAD family phosphatase [Clostridiales bacterium]
MIKAVIFDMDGLMIDSERVTYDGYVIEFGKLGYPYTKEFYKKLLGKRMPQIYEIHRQAFGEDIDAEGISANVHKYMADRFETEGVPLKKGLTELLQFLKEQQIKTVVATSSTRNRVDHIFELAQIADYFDASVCGDEVTHSKPDPETFLKACEKIGVSPSEAIVLEDSEAGIEAAYNGHIPVICVPDMKYPEPRFEQMAWKIAGSLLDVRDILAKFLSSEPA